MSRKNHQFDAEGGLRFRVKKEKRKAEPDGPAKGGFCGFKKLNRLPI